MLSDPSLKYGRREAIAYDERTWPNKRIEKAPIWCSTDLRDGSQALAAPMSVDTKRAYLALLLDIGFTEIEIGFPSASRDDYAFARWLAQSGIERHVRFQALTQARSHLIEKTIESLAGVRHATVNLYIGTAPLFRDVVFGTDKNGLIRMACDGARRVTEHASRHPQTAWRFQFTPEMFVATEPNFALDICNAVIDVWRPSAENPVILNLESTVEIASPNVYADQIEWFASRIQPREAIIISAHPHNDRGTAIAAGELALLAGADRLEGCLFGNGERAGNADLMVLAANLYAQGLHPGLDLSRLAEYRKTFESLAPIPIHPRHPYAGDLAFTTFAGTHQDGVRKGLLKRGSAGKDPWAVPYLPIDPSDFGISCENLIRVNGQSGKAGAAFVVENHLGITLPRDLQSDFYGHVQHRCEMSGGEITASEIIALFRSLYGFEPGGLLDFEDHPARSVFGAASKGPAVAVKLAQRRTLVAGTETGVFSHILGRVQEQTAMILDPVSIEKIGTPSGNLARTAVLVTAGRGEARLYGLGIDRDSRAAAIKGLFAIANRMIAATDEIAKAA